MLRPCCVTDISSWSVMEIFGSIHVPREPWNQGKLVSQKTPFKLKAIYLLV